MSYGPATHVGAWGRLAAPRLRPRPAHPRGRGLRRARPAPPGSRPCSTGSTSRCASPSPARSRPVSPPCSTPSSARSWRRPTPASARRSSPGTATASPTGPPSSPSRGRAPPGAVLPRRRRHQHRPRRLQRRHVERLVVEWPSSSLRQMTLIDTPGIASLSTDVSARTHAFLTPGEDQVTPADAVLYLMRHLHASDINFLEAFHDEEFSQATPVNAVAVLSRADEVGVGRIDSMASAQRIARRYRSDAKVRRLAQTVVPVAGLLAQSGATLREAEYKALDAIAGASHEEAEALFLSADRFVSAQTPIAPDHDGARAPARTGSGSSASGCRCRSSARAWRPTPRRCRPSWSGAAGCVELREVLLSQFAQRRDVLKARSALLALERELHERPGRRRRHAGHRARADHVRGPRVRRDPAAQRAAGGRAQGQAGRGRGDGAPARRPGRRPLHPARPAAGGRHLRGAPGAAERHRPLAAPGRVARCRPARWPTRPGCSSAPARACSSTSAGRRLAGRPLAGPVRSGSPPSVRRRGSAGEAVPQDLDEGVAAGRVDLEGVGRGQHRVEAVEVEVGADAAGGLGTPSNVPSVVRRSASGSATAASMSRPRCAGGRRARGWRRAVDAHGQGGEEGVLVGVAVDVAVGRRRRCGAPRPRSDARGRPAWRRSGRPWSGSGGARSRAPSPPGGRSRRATPRGRRGRTPRPRPPGGERGWRWRRHAGAGRLPASKRGERPV